MKKLLKRLRAKSRSLQSGQLVSPRQLFSHTNSQVGIMCRERLSPVYIGEGRVLSRALGRYTLRTNSSDTGFAPHILMDGFWEIWLTRWMVENVKPGWTAIDVGANYGYYSVLLADLVGVRGKLLAFEPNPECSDATQFAITINGFSHNAAVHEVALSNVAGDCTFFVPKNEPKNGHLEMRRAKVTTVEESELGTRFPVPMATLDERVAHLDRVDFIKIDAEGAEQAIFEGMQETISRHNPLIVMEFNNVRGQADAFAQKLREVYPYAQYLESDGSVNPVDFDRLMTDRRGVDWLLLLQK
ncbi:FkbM family methyltransferase [Altererythrobacter lutimaris]|uniref:FkbM family methyltransferase n=1 Tax=Altererythrobacter lutimaris TaxID=2743979 RepID=A0A850HB63_9SPHN|nr:FkbM family methyltransferase [Altererythrobacter lutimaris]NVE95293.1 FkbM family methyltransferase [Altererythrobacter lutimaris]